MFLDIYCSLFLHPSYKWVQLFIVSIFWGNSPIFRGPGSAVGIATALRVWGPGDRIPVGARFSSPVQTGPGAQPASCTMVTGSFPEVKSGRGVTLTLHPLLVPWSWESRAIPLLPLWTVWPVQSLSACTRGHFTFYCIIIYSALILLSIFW